MKRALLYPNPRAPQGEYSRTEFPSLYSVHPLTYHAVAVAFRAEGYEVAHVTQAPMVFH